MSGLLLTPTKERWKRMEQAWGRREPANCLTLPYNPKMIPGIVCTEPIFLSLSPFLSHSLEVSTHSLPSTVGREARQGKRIIIKAVLSTVYRLHRWVSMSLFSFIAFISISFRCISYVFLLLILDVPLPSLPPLASSSGILPTSSNSRMWNTKMKRFSICLTNNHFLKSISWEPFPLGQHL